MRSGGISGEILMLGAMRAPHVFAPDDERLTGHASGFLSSFRRVSTLHAVTKDLLMRRIFKQRKGKRQHFGTLGVLYLLEEFRSII
jgi:hypothetical protein